MNTTIELLSNHASIRSFTNQPLTEEQREAIFKAANQTSSFSLLRPFQSLELQIQIFEKSDGAFCESALY